MKFAWMVGVLACACATVAEPPPVPLAAPNRATFEVDAAPYLAKRCGDVLCHGRDDRAFKLYAVGRHRMAAAEQFTAKPLTAAEVDANYFSLLGFDDHPQPRQTTLLRKALGQMGHKGGAVLEAPSDPPFRALEAWLAGKDAP